MENIKTYRHVNKTNVDRGFRISRMEELYAQFAGEHDLPHRHDFYTVLLIKEGQGEHLIDFREYSLAGLQVYFVGPGQVHQLKPSVAPIGYAMLFSEDFLMQNNIPARFIEDLNLFHDYGESPPLQLSQEELECLEEYCAQVYDYYDSERKFKDQAIGALIELFLIACNNLCLQPVNNNQSLEAGNSLLRQFKLLLELHHTEWHATSLYAKALHITPDHLNRTLKALTGKTTKDFIQSRLVVAAKRMLFFTELNAKEIGYGLGYSEPANFSAFFKKYTGYSPTEFRSRH